MSVAVLDREIFSEAEAARLLHVPQGTLNYWLNGRTQRGHAYPPIIRTEARQDRVVTWAEFVEAGLLRSYRRDLNVSMLQIRTFVDVLRERFDIPYPLAHALPFVGEGRQLMYEAQEQAGLDPELFLIATARDQLVLTPASEVFFERVDWDQDLAVAWRPAAESESPVRIDPEMRFGRPSVSGVSTETIWEHADTGASLREISDDFGLELADVRWAISYESARLAA